MTALSPHSAAQLQDLLKTKKAEEPKKAWRNRWEVQPGATSHSSSSRITYGPATIWSDHVHPSKEIAEQRAIEANHFNAINQPPEFRNRWLGAFSVETP